MKVLVTGGGGFLGSAICRLLRERGDEPVSLARNRYPQLDWLHVRQIAGDVTNLDAVCDAARGCDAVVHAAALAGMWGSLDEYYATNVGGTDNVIAGCFMSKVPRLVYTSSPSVVHTGGDLEGVDERTPYATHFSANYPRTKAIAEQRVLNANGPDLATVALRPHLVWGPGDNHLMPRIVDRARRGRLRFVGRTPKKIDATYVDNAAQAHLDALDRVAPGAPCAGRAYFISNDAPWVLDEVINAMLYAAGMEPEKRRISLRTALAVGRVCESVWGLLRLVPDPPMTRFLAEQLATAHWFDISAAKRDLGYQPKVTMGEGFGRLADWWKREHGKRDGANAAP
jgi:nucleoside-diphosphate-sugar epimerase